MTDDLRIEARAPSVAEFRRIVTAVGWDQLAAHSDDVLQRSLDAALFSVCALSGDECVGCVRVIGDGGLHFYLEEVAVVPAWQGRGAGRRLLEAVVEWLRLAAPPGAAVELLTGLDRAGFYGRFGFVWEGGGNMRWRPDGATFARASAPGWTSASASASADGLRLRAVAPDVHWLALGSGWRAANVYFLGTSAAWCLVDAGWGRDASPIRRAAGALFGDDARPAGIVLTHDHPDHAGAVRELALAWDCPAYVHPDELSIANGDVGAIRRFAGPLDRFVILPALRLAGRRRMASLLARSSLAGVVQALDPEQHVPGLAEWAILKTPGHTPGHISLYRAGDGVAITGDALNTIDVNSPRSLIRGERRLAGPPWYTSWDWQRAMASARAVATLAPRLVCPGHGAPLSGDALAAEAARFLRERSL